MRLKQYLTEKFEETLSIYHYGKSEIVEIFKNPNSREYRDAKKANKDPAKSVRGLSDGKNIWIWRGDILHYEIEDAKPKFYPRNYIHFELVRDDGIMMHSATIFLKQEKVYDIVDKILKFAPELKFTPVALDDEFLD